MSFNIYVDQVDDLNLVIKALVWKYGLERASSVKALPSAIRVFLSEQELRYAKNRLEVAVANQQDPWGMEITVIDYDNNTVDEKLKNAFGSEVPSPETLKRAYKRVYGIDLT